MDSKKANLTPELKEIYDRVMNTSGTPVKAAPPQPNAQQPNIPQPGGSTPQPGLSQAPSQGMPSIGETPPPHAQQPQMPPPTLQSPPQQTPSAQMPPPGAPTPAEEALTNTPARPVTEGNSFSFSGGSVKSATPQKSASPTGKKKTIISKPILIALAVVFVAVWGVFWAIIFGLIQR